MSDRKPSDPLVPDKFFFRIGDAAKIVGVKPYVLRYWETEFSSISPEKSTTGQRVYRKSEVETLVLIKHLLYTERYSIEGARKRLKELKKQERSRVQVQTSGEAIEPQDGPDPVATARLLDGLRSHVSQLRGLAEKTFAEL